MTNLKSIREQKGITQAQLASMIGVTQGAVSAWETGRWEPSLYTIRKISNALKCTTDELIGGADDES